MKRKRSIRPYHPKTHPQINNEIVQIVHKCEKLAKKRHKQLLFNEIIQNQPGDYRHRADESRISRAVEGLFGQFNSSVGVLTHGRSHFIRGRGMKLQPDNVPVNQSFHHDE